MPYLQIRDDRGRKVACLETEEGGPPPVLPAGFTVEPADDAPLWVAPPAVVGLWQFAGQAEAEGIITAQECEAWVRTGKVPVALLGAVEAVIPDPAAQRPVLLFLMGAREFPLAHPNTVAFAAMFGKDTPEKLEAFFRSAGHR